MNITVLKNEEEIKIDRKEIMERDNIVYEMPKQ